MHAHYNNETNATEGEYYISQILVFFEINDDTVWAYIIEECETGENKDRVEEECNFWCILNERPTNRHKKWKKIEKCSENKKVLCNTQMKICTF